MVHVRVYFSPSGILKVDEIFTEKKPRRWESHVNSWGQKEGLLKFCKAHFGPGILNFVALHASQRSYPKGCCKLSGWMKLDIMSQECMLWIALILWSRSTHFHKRLCWHGFYIFLPGRCGRVCLKNRGPQNQLHATAPGHPKHHAQELEGPLAFGEFKWFSFRLVFGDVHIWNWRDDWSFGRFPWVQLKLETSSKFPIGLAVVFGAVWLFLDQVQGSLLLLQLVPTRLKDTCCQKTAPFFGENLCCAWGNNVADEGCRVLFDTWLVLVVTCDIHVLGVRTRRFKSNSC